MTGDTGLGPVRGPTEFASNGAGPMMQRAVVRPAATFVACLVGLLLASALFAGSAWMWVLWIAVGSAAGTVAGRGSLIWAAWLAVLAFFPVSGRLGVPGDSGRFWAMGVIVGLAEVGIGFLVGIAWARRTAPWSVARSAWHGLPRFPRRFLAAAATAGLIAALLYTAAIGVLGSNELLFSSTPTRDCRTPAQYDWPYEAINYDQADDLRLAAENPDMRRCASQGAVAGTAVVSSDGVHVAGFYIPAANGIGPDGPTVILVPGWKANKSSMLAYASPFHTAFNVVAIDLRNTGRSSRADTTGGLREQRDLKAMIDWLERTKQPRWIGVMGNSLGAATALAEAVGDPRIRALVLDSMHAQAVVTGGRILETEKGQPSLPGAWAATAMVSLRIGADITQVDPVRTITQVGARPVLLIHGTADAIDRPEESAERNFHAALAAGVPVELEYCQGGEHGKLIGTWDAAQGSLVGPCSASWARWAVSFLSAASLG